MRKWRIDLATSRQYGEYQYGKAPQYARPINLKSYFLAVDNNLGSISK